MSVEERISFEPVLDYTNQAKGIFANPTFQSLLSALIAQNGNGNGNNIIKRGVNTRDCSQLATSGVGSYASPFRGFTTAIDNFLTPLGGNAAVFLPSGIYEHDGSFNFAKYPNVTFKGERGTVLISTGATVAKFKGERQSVEPGKNHSYGIIFEDILLDGGGNAANGIDFGAVHHSRIEAECRNVTSKAFWLGFSVLNRFNLRCTNRIGNNTASGFTPSNPVNGLVVDGIDPNGVSGAFFQCNKVFIIVETVTGAGIILGNAHQNEFFGSSETNGGTGLIINSTSDDNTFIGCDFENANNGLQLDCNGNNNQFINLICPDGIAKITNGRANKIIGGIFNTLQVEAGASNTRVDAPMVGRSGGSFIDNSATTAIVGKIQGWSGGNQEPALKMPGNGVFSGTVKSGGVVLTSPNGTDYKLIVANDGTISSVPAQATNYALASNGATITGTAPINGNFALSAVINGARHTNSAWGTANGGYASAVGLPANVDITFSQARTISEIDVFTLADATNYSTNPTLSDTFSSSNGMTGFDVQYWNGSAWITIQSVTGNNKVWRQFVFAPITTTKIRINCTASADNIARIVEVEAWG